MLNMKYVYNYNDYALKSEHKATVRVSRFLDRAMPLYARTTPSSFQQIGQLIEKTDIPQSVRNMNQSDSLKGFDCAVATELKAIAEITKGADKSGIFDIILVRDMDAVMVDMSRLPNVKKNAIMNVVYAVRNAQLED